MKTRSQEIQDQVKNLVKAFYTKDQDLQLKSVKCIQQESNMLQRDYEYYKEKDQERNKFSIADLCESLQKEIESDFIEILQESYPQDRLHEIADNYIPIYNWELTQYLANDFSLSEVDDSGLIEGVTCIFKIIQTSIYEHLSSAAYDQMTTMIEEKQDHFQYMLDRYSDYLSMLEDKQNDLEDQDLDQWGNLETRINTMQDKVNYFDELVTACNDF